MSSAITLRTAGTGQKIYENVIQGNVIRDHKTSLITKVGFYFDADNNTQIVNNIIIGNSIEPKIERPVYLGGTLLKNNIVHKNLGIVTEASGVTAAINGDTIPFSLPEAPSDVQLTTTDSASIVGVSSITSTGFGIVMRNFDGTLVTTARQVRWKVSIY